MKKYWGKIVIFIVTIALVLLGTGYFASTSAQNIPSWGTPGTTTPIKHVVVIFQENISFDHYFGTYPYATNPTGEPAFHASRGTPRVNGLTVSLLTHNPNTANPKRLDHSQALTCDQDHGYTDEQKAYDAGKADKFVQFTAGGSCTDKTTVMDYFDGNTVTAMWNYAQHDAMSDNSFNTVYGPSTPGAINLISGQTHGLTSNSSQSEAVDGTLIGDSDPIYDDCSTTNGNIVGMTGKNVGDLLNAKHVTWGWFEGGFRPTATTNGVAKCGATHQNIGGATVTDYVPHHQPFQYYQSTANPHHLPPSSTAMIGQTDQANHQYDLQDFWAAVKSGNIPAVSFLKAAAYQDGHAGYSDPLDEQNFLVTTINQLEKSSAWSSTAVVIAYDDSDGWYDHVTAPIVSPSQSTADALTGSGLCGKAPANIYEGRCGYGPRLPLLVISPYARQNYVDHTLTDQSSILRFIEENWQVGRIGDHSFDAIAGSLGGLFDFHTRQLNKPLYLDPSTGEPV
jgi:phospholipase C